jgi:hypothetical protein
MKRDEMVARWRKLRNEKFYNIHSLLNITRMNKSRKCIQGENVVGMGRRGIHRGFWWESQKERDH